MARKSNFAGRSEPALAKRPEAAASSSMEQKVLLTPHILILLPYTYLLSSLTMVGGCACTCDTDTDTARYV